MNAKEKTAYNALRIAMDIHRRVLKLQSDWVAFDPYGAEVYELLYLADNGLALREAVISSRGDWDFRDKVLHYRQVAPYKSGYASFKEQIKGIEGALRRFKKTGYGKGKEEIEFPIEAMRVNFRNLREQM